MRVRWFAGVLAVTLLACGSQESRMDRGAVVGEEEAVPESNKDMAETADQRRAQEEREEKRASREAFDEAEQEAGH